jgi:hypothetical protein
MFKNNLDKMMKDKESSSDMHAILRQGIDDYPQVA